MTLLGIALFLTIFITALWCGMEADNEAEIALSILGVVKQYTDLEADYMMLKAENEQLKVENSEWELDNEQLRSELAATQKILDAAVEDIEKMMRICEKGSCRFCADGDCTDSPYCSPKWRGAKSGAE